MEASLKPKHDPRVYRALRETYPALSNREIAALLGDVSEGAVRRGLKLQPPPPPPRASDMLDRAAQLLAVAGL